MSDEEPQLPVRPFLIIQLGHDVDATLEMANQRVEEFTRKWEETHYVDPPQIITGGPDGLTVVVMAIEKGAAQESASRSGEHQGIMSFSAKASEAHLAQQMREAMGGVQVGSADQLRQMEQQGQRSKRGHRFGM